MTHEQKLERWAEREITRNINHIILEQDDGSILAFGRYDIQPTAHGVTVSANNTVLAHFDSRRTALTWCVAQHKHLVNFGIHIQAIDERYRTQRTDQEHLQGQLRRCRDQQRRHILRAKLQHKQSHVQMLRNELEKCAVKAKYLQLRGFEK